MLAKVPGCEIAFCWGDNTTRAAFFVPPGFSNVFFTRYCEVSKRYYTTVLKHVFRYAFQNGFEFSSLDPVEGVDENTNPNAIIIPTPR